jgi:membrane-associated protease RseP (regulator of RpoE activity)
MRLAPAGLVLLAVTPAAAQQTLHVGQAAPGWLGISYDVQWVQEGSACSPQVVVESVVHGSPAERAGLRAGDAILTLDGEPVPGGRLQVLAARLQPGDSIQLRVQRGGTDREILAVADRRPDRPVSILVERGFETSVVPLVEVDGDRLIARNLDTGWSTDRLRSYRLSREDGRTEYRSLTGWSTTDVDEKVVRLLTCADSTRSQGPIWVEPSPARVNMQRLQERADSLRVIITQRALKRQEDVKVLSGVPTLPDDRTVMFVGPEGNFTFRVEDHVAVGLRGVAGAELTALEPELAEYFRNADRGLLVLRIAPDTPADRAGLVPGDVVVAANGRRVESVPEFRQILTLPQAGGVELRVVRRGRTLDLRLQRD